jgi:hypothetical protein
MTIENENNRNLVKKERDKVNQARLPLLIMLGDFNIQLPGRRNAKTIGPFLFGDSCDPDLLRLSGSRPQMPRA